MIPEKELIERIEALEKRLSEIDELIKIAEERRAKTIMNDMLDGPIMMFGKHNIGMDQINKK